MKNTSNQKIALLYAQALYDGAGKRDELAALYQCMPNFLQSISGAQNQLKQLNSPLLEDSVKESALTEIANKINLPVSLLNVMKLMAQNRKLHLLEIMLTQFKTIYQDQNNIAEVKVFTVIPLSEKQEKLLKQKLSTIFKKEIILRYEINSQIIGGLVLQYGTHFIDNSVKHKLDALEQFMKGTR